MKWFMNKIIHQVPNSKCKYQLLAINLFLRHSLYQSHKNRYTFNINLEVSMKNQKMKEQIRVPTSSELQEKASLNRMEQNDYINSLRIFRYDRYDIKDLLMNANLLNDSEFKTKILKTAQFQKQELKLNYGNIDIMEDQVQNFRVNNTSSIIQGINSMKKSTLITQKRIENRKSLSKKSTSPTKVSKSHKQQWKRQDQFASSSPIFSWLFRRMAKTPQLPTSLYQKKDEQQMEPLAHHHHQQLELSPIAFHQFLHQQLQLQSPSQSPLFETKRKAE